MKPARWASCSEMPCSASNTQHDDVRVLDRLHRLDDREFLDRFQHLAAAAHARGVDQHVVAAVALEIEIDRVARRSRLVEGDHALLAQQVLTSVDLPTFGRPMIATLTAPASVGACIAGASASRGGRRERQRPLGDFGHVVAVRGRHRMRLAQAELVELARGALRRQTFRLVGGQDDRPARAAQQIGDVPVLRGDALSRVDEKDDDVGLGDRLPRLFRHLEQDAFGRDGLEPAGVDDEIRPARRCGRDRSADRASGRGNRRRARRAIASVD